MCPRNGLRSGPDAEQITARGGTPIRILISSRRRSSAYWRRHPWKKWRLQSVDAVRAIRLFLRLMKNVPAPRSCVGSMTVCCRPNGSEPASTVTRRCSRPPRPHPAVQGTGGHCGRRRQRRRSQADLTAVARSPLRCRRAPAPQSEPVESLVKPWLPRVSIASSHPCGGIDSNSVITRITCVTSETVMLPGNT